MRTRTSRSLVCGAIFAMFVAGLARPAFAQSSTEAAGPNAGQEERELRGFEDENTRRLLERRERETLHPGIPLDLVGNEAGGNDFRVATPLLSRSEHAPTLVDRDENYRRRLAMYDSHARFSTPVPPTAGPGAARAEAPVIARQGATTSDEDDGESSGFMKYLAMLLAVVAAIFAWRRRYLLQF